jgi:YggT family protein
MSYLQNAGAFLLQSIAGFVIVIFLLRVMLIAVNAPFNEPICRFVYLLTNPAVTPLRRFVPRWGRIELAAILIAWVVAAVQLALLVALFGLPVGAVAIVVRDLVDTLDWAVLIQLIAIFAYCILSFIPSLRYDSNFSLLARFVDPVVRPFRRLLPPLGGMDFSCWFASVALILVRMLAIAPLSDLAMRLG